MGGKQEDQREQKSMDGRKSSAGTIWPDCFAICFTSPAPITAACCNPEGLAVWRERDTHADLINNGADEKLELLHLSSSSAPPRFLGSSCPVPPHFTGQSREREER